MRLDSFNDLRLPLMAAPMFIASSLELCVAACEAGVIGSFPAGNARSLDGLSHWLTELAAREQQARAEGRRFGPFGVNIPATGARKQEDHRSRLTLCEQARVPLIISGIGDPTEIVRAAHGWGAYVFHDVTTVRFAEKAIEAGVDGLMLTCAGSGGHTGDLSPFAFLPRLRRDYPGVIALSGGLATGDGIYGALALGADIACMGTRFIATTESGVVDDYRAMLVGARTAEVLRTDAISGMVANFLEPSIRAAGLDPANLPRPLGLHQPNLPTGVKPWKGLWSAGHSVGLVTDVPPVATLVDRLAREFERRPIGDWRARLATRLAGQPSS